MKFCSGQNSSTSVPSKESPHLISQALEVENSISTTTLFEASPTNGGKNTTIKIETSSLHDASNHNIFQPPPPNENEAEFGHKLLYGMDNLSLDFPAHGLYVLYCICTVFVQCCA
jgi:hypothetical protein